MESDAIIYSVFIDEGLNSNRGRLELELTEQEYAAINLSFFVELGMIVTVHKFNHGTIQNNE